MLVFGGCGKEATLIGLRRVLPAGLDSLVVEPEMNLTVGMLEVEFAWRVNSADEDDVDPKGGRSPSLDDAYDVEVNLVEMRVSKAVGTLFRNPGGGKGGNAA